MNENSTISTPSFYAAIAKFRRNPPLYIGNRSLHNFAYWLHGYSAALFDMTQDISDEEQEFSEFSAFVARKTRMARNAHWSKNILYYHEDDGSALDYFFELFDEFREKKQKQKARKKPVRSTAQP